MPFHDIIVWTFPSFGPTLQAIHERVHTSVFTTLVCIMRPKPFLKVNHADFPKIWPPTVCLTVYPVSFYYSFPTKCWKFEATCNTNFNFIGYIKKFDRMIACPSSLPIQSTLKEVIKSIDFSYFIYIYIYIYAEVWHRKALLYVLVSIVPCWGRCSFVDLWKLIILYEMLAVICKYAELCLFCQYHCLRHIFLC
jgi:hypothetical protein